MTNNNDTAIYIAKNRICLGAPEETANYDDFTVSNVITIGGKKMIAK